MTRRVKPTHRLFIGCGPVVKQASAVVTDGPMTERALEEYKALRATIRERGTARTWIFVVGLSAWAAMTLAAMVVPVPMTTLVPLLALAGTFEAVFALHASVERIGRYLQIVHEDAWEETAMAFGPPLAGTGTDPLFALLFGLAALVNFVPVLLAAPLRVELAVIGVAHALFLVRLAAARVAAGRQRTADLERFRHLANARRANG
jgi:hypothetical protein